MNPLARHCWLFFFSDATAREAPWNDGFYLVIVVVVVVDWSNGPFVEDFRHPPGDRTGTVRAPVHNGRRDGCASDRSIRDDFRIVFARTLVRIFLFFSFFCEGRYTGTRPLADVEQNIGNGGGRTVAMV